MNIPAMTQQQQKFTEQNLGPLALYKELAVGADQSYLQLFNYELITLVAKNLSGALGIGLRKVLYKLILKTQGKGGAVGSGVTLRQPSKISIGKRVIIDDYVTLDVRGDDASITIGDSVVIGRFTTIAAKNGRVVIENGANIGSYCRVATQSKIVIGESVLIAAFCYIGPGNHKKEDQNKTLIESQMEIKGGVEIGAYSWVGAHSTVLDGVKTGREAVIGAHSLVKDNVEAGVTVAGAPARALQ